MSRSAADWECERGRGATSSPPTSRLDTASPPYIASASCTATSSRSCAASALAASSQRQTVVPSRTGCDPLSIVPSQRRPPHGSRRSPPCLRPLPAVRTRSGATDRLQPWMGHKRIDETMLRPCRRGPPSCAAGSRASRSGPRDGLLGAGAGGGHADAVDGGRAAWSSSAAEPAPSSTRSGILATRIESNALKARGASQNCASEHVHAHGPSGERGGPKVWLDPTATSLLAGTVDTASVW
jgi:hypothetical protein